MAAITLQAYPDNSTFANFSSWASAISSFLSGTAGWSQTTDTGQVMWSGMNLTQVVMSGSNATYTYNSLTGQPLFAGRALTITGMTNAVNNGVFIIASVGIGTFTVINAAGVNESGSSGHVTAQTTVPGNGAYFYEIWQPNDGLNNFFLRIDYGNSSGQTNMPSLRMWLGVYTNGIGSIVGPQQMGQWTIPANTFGTSATVPYQCYLSGEPGRFSILMWRQHTSCMAFGVERSINSSGVYTSSHVTMLHGGYTGWNSSVYQQTMLLNANPLYAVACPIMSQTNNSTNGGMTCRAPYVGITTQNNLVNGIVGFDTYAPYVGYFDNNLTNFGVGPQQNFQDGQIVQATIYGVTRTYICSTSGSTSTFGPAGRASTLFVRYD